MMTRLYTVIQIGLLISFPILGTQAKAQQVIASDKDPADLILGVLEDVPGNSVGESDFRAVRAIFKKSGSEWKPFPTRCKSYTDLKLVARAYPKDVEWTVAFNGHSLGSVTARTPPEFRFYSLIGIENITSRGPVPTVGEKSPIYSGFLATPVYRPLVAVSQRNFTDPDQWKRSRLPEERVAVARRQFRAKFPKVVNCKNPDENIPRPWMYHDEDIKAGKTYTSNKDWSLVELSLTGWACDGRQENGSAFTGQWYAVKPSGTLEFLGTDMWLVDAGDYDNDGESEVLFSINGYNKGGYRLFYEDFSKSVEFIFTYH